MEELTDVNKSRSRIKLMQELLFSSGTVLKESAWLVVFPNCNEHIGHAVGNVSIIAIDVTCCVP